MLVLNSYSDRVQAKTDEATVTTELSYNVSYKDTFTNGATGYGFQQTAGTGTSIVTILDNPAVFGGQAPRAGTTRRSMSLHIHNADTIDHVITVYYNRDGTLYIIFKITLKAGYTANMPSGGPVQVVDDTGAVLTGTGTGTGGGGGETPVVATYLWHFNTNGTDKSNNWTFVDQTTGNPVTISTTQKKFGAGSVENILSQPIRVATWNIAASFFNTSYTFEFWTYMDYLPATGNIPRFRIIGAGTPSGWTVQLEPSNSQIQWNYAGDFGNRVVAVTPAIGRWVHTAVVFDDPNNQYRLYHDGNLVDSVTSAGFGIGQSAGAYELNLATIAALSGPDATKHTFYDELAFFASIRYTGATYTIPSAEYE